MPIRKSDQVVSFNEPTKKYRPEPFDVCMTTFPLPRNFFRCPPLSPREVAHFTTEGEQDCVRAIRYANIVDGPIKWTLDSSFENTQIYVGKDPQAGPQVSVWCGVTEVQSTIEEVARRFKTETTDDYLEFCQTFAKDIADASNLYTVVRSTPANPLRAIMIKWFVLGSPMPFVVKSRDYCFLDSCHEFSIDGRRGWVQSFKSIMMPCCPDLQASLGVVRADIFAGSVFMESTRPGYIRVVRTWHSDAKGMVPRFLVSRSIKLRCVAMRDFKSNLQESSVRNAMPPLLPPSDLVSHDSRARCFLCNKGFGPFSTKKNCRVCGEVMCRYCIRWLRVKGEKLNLCVMCFMVPAKMDQVPRVNDSESEYIPSLDDSILYGSFGGESEEFDSFYPSSQIQHTITLPIGKLPGPSSVDGSLTVPSVDDSAFYRHGATEDPYFFIPEDDFYHDDGHLNYDMANHDVSTYDIINHDTIDYNNGNTIPVHNMVHPVPIPHNIPMLTPVQHNVVKMKMNATTDVNYRNDMNVLPSTIHVSKPMTEPPSQVRNDLIPLDGPWDLSKPMRR
ncbi:unnamed protein product [Aphanomyces euteiches]